MRYLPNIHFTGVAGYERREGFEIGRERVQGFMRQMGLHAIYPKGNVRKKQPGHKIYPYLPADIEITYPNQVWASVSTYLRLQARIRVPCGYYRLA
ncbi:MAG: hypothetical protein KGQ83_08570 [Planctomycetes bacterium]|nr:hypothetical protein [Planctomycetota bacterium]MDE1890750.1 hypothetical protein [Planctomycetota bacterium]